MKIALLIGVNDYDSRDLANLNYAANDAEALKERLVRFCGFDEGGGDEIVVMGGRGGPRCAPSQGNILDALNRFCTLPRYRGPDLFFFSFSGHGFHQGEDDFLCARDSRINLLPQTAITEAYVEGCLKQIRARNTVMLLDMCRNIPGRGAGAATCRETLDSLGRNIVLEESERRGLGLDYVPSGLIFNACGVGERANEWPDRGLGVFTACFCDALEEGGPLSEIIDRTVSKTSDAARGLPGFPSQMPYSKTWGGIVRLVDAGRAPRAAAGGGPRRAAAGERKQAPEESAGRWDVLLPGGVKLEMVRIRAGTFLMGSPEGEPGRYDDERRHRVTLTRDYWIGKFPVTQAQYEAVTGKNPSRFAYGGDYPEEQVSWYDARAFCEKLNRICAGGLPEGCRFDLPTEAQWEYACRAGTETALNTGECPGPMDGRPPPLDGAGWYEENSGGETHPAGLKRPNAWGLFDMHGNVWEWCRDRYDRDAYGGGGGDAVDPMGPAAGADRALRGGGWPDGGGDCRSACRSYNSPSLFAADIGFRIVCSAG